MDTLAEAPFSSLSGVARVLVHAGKLNGKTAEALVKSAAERKSSFVSALIAAGSVSATDLAHTLANALALPLLDLASVDAERLPRNVIDNKLVNQYQVVVLGKRGNRLFIGGADPTDQEAVERIKFATQLSPEWVIVEYDKLGKLLEKQGTSATETLESMAAGLPMVATDCGAVRDLVEEDATGHLVPVGDVQRLAARIAELAGDPERRARFGAAGRARVEHDFGIDRTAAGYERLLTELTRGA